MILEGNRTYSVQLPDSTGKTIEYYITTNVDGKKLCYPASAPEINSTWVRL